MPRPSPCLLPGQRPRVGARWLRMHSVVVPGLQARQTMPIKMDEGTLLAVLNAAAHEGDPVLARMAWNLLVRALAADFQSELRST
jgi:hypothetical protein